MLAKATDRQRDSDQADGILDEMSGNRRMLGLRIHPLRVLSHWTFSFLTLSAKFAPSVAVLPE